jgi:hypothetical protein
MAKDDKLEPTEELLDEEELVSRRDVYGHVKGDQ